MVNKKISHKKFLILLVLFSLIIRVGMIVPIHNQIQQDIGVMYKILIVFCSKNVFLKFVNIILNIFSILLVYRITNRMNGKKIAQLITVLYSVFINTILYNNVLSNYHLFLFLNLLAFDLFFENKIKNKNFRLIVISVILAVLTLISSEAIIFVLAYIIYILFFSRSDSKTTICSIAILIGVYGIVLSFGGIALKRDINTINIFNGKELNLECLHNVNTYWNNFDNDLTLSYLAPNIESEDFLENYIYEFYDFAKSFDSLIWGFIVICAFMSLKKRENKEKKMYTLVTLISFIIHALISWEDGFFSYIYRPFVFILAGYGIKVVIESGLINLEKARLLRNYLIDKYIKIKNSRKAHIVILFILSIILTKMVLIFSPGELGELMYHSYYYNPWILVLNFLPIFYISILIYGITRKISFSFLVSGICAYTISVVNNAKMQLRNDNLLMEDIFLIREATNIEVDYSLIINFFMIFCIFAIICTFLALYIFIDRKQDKTKKKTKILIRILEVVVLFVIGILGFNTFYVNEYFYNKTINERNFEGSMWTSRNKYISRGAVYSFLHSYTSMTIVPPKGYKEKDVEQKLFSYEYSDIDEDKKVNIISIMLESYNDFSKFEELDFEKNPYTKLHEVENESYSGELVTSIFGGGTIDTERKFLTGYANLPSFRKKTNSYVTYFNEQGYYTEGSHPSYSWFYNRNIINNNLGFNKYYFEDKYEPYSRDEILFEEIFNLYKDYTNKSNVPYFSFNVTYQNHLPYWTDGLNGDEYVEKLDNMSDEEYHILNNYFWGIEDTNNKIYSLIEKLKLEKEPIVLILFGDHNPSLGEIYEKLGINFDFSTEEGCYNYYSTPYIIWANNKAKRVLDNNFIGKGETISPNFLMNKFFELAGYDGNEYMKFVSEIMEDISVINDEFYVEDGKIVYNIEKQEGLNEFNKIQYYWSNKYRIK